MYEIKKTIAKILNILLLNDIDNLIENNLFLTIRYIEQIIIAIGPIVIIYALELIKFNKDTIMPKSTPANAIMTSKFC